MSFPSLQLISSLRAYLQGEEFRQSYTSFSDEIIDKVLRYGAPVGSLIEEHKTLPRCMGRLQEMISCAQQDENPLPNGTVVIAQELLDGCGRFDREWFAPSGGIWMAVAWADTLLPEFARLLPMATGIASCQAIKKFGVDAAVKWVNDIHVHGRKVGGVLCETVSGAYHDDRYHLIGIGINCNNSSFPQDLQGKATSILDEIHGSIDLNLFTLELLARLAWNFGLIHLAEEQFLAWEKNGSHGKFVNPVITAWKEVSDTVGRRVVYGYDVIRKPLYNGTVVDVDPSGGLVVQLENGSVVIENSGEIIYLSD